MLQTQAKKVNKKPSFLVTRRAFSKLILSWVSLITLTAYTDAKSRFLDRIIDASERGCE